ncbi:helix-turn-helix transcriptional regulator [Mycolicibacterium fallax]|uniref:helix-turn-helix transcriptional regulator n=1 Tax=Mycolicibacterium fallax TaxID=1793 RepID=UPI000A1698FF|nr:helix-turn-helix domain-containing protein [Mycolicibacterium fallax]BBY99627.1 hypothetical protein MFAL_30940 [Mycolicibacterium fallax]
MARRKSDTAAAPAVDVDAEFLTPVQVSQRLKVSRQTLSYWRSRNTGPLSFALGHTVRYPAAELEQWISDQMRETARGGVSA